MSSVTDMFESLNKNGINHKTDGWIKVSSHQLILLFVLNHILLFFFHAFDHHHHNQFRWIRFPYCKRHALISSDQNMQTNAEFVAGMTLPIHVELPMQK